jgi:hypothetical protein
MVTTAGAVVISFPFNILVFGKNEINWLWKILAKKLR